MEDRFRKYKARTIVRLLDKNELTGWDKLNCIFRAMGLLIEQDSEIKQMRGALLWTLYHHQGGSSHIGQPIRRVLGIGQHDHLTEKQVAEAKKFAAQTGKAAP